MSAAKAIEQEINNYLEHLNSQQKKVVLNLVKTIAGEEDNWWADVEHDAKKSINKGLAQEKKGELTSHNDAMKKYKKWLSK